MVDEELIKHPQLLENQEVQNILRKLSARSDREKEKLHNENEELVRKEESAQIAKVN